MKKSPVKFYGNMIRQLENETTFNTFFSDVLKKVATLGDDEFYEKLYDFIEMDADEFIEFFANPTHRKIGSNEEIIYKVICNFFQFETIDQAKDLIKYYGKYITILNNPNLFKKQSALSIKDNILNHLEDKQSISYNIDLIISKFINYNEFTKKDLKDNDNEIVIKLNKLVDLKEEFDLDLLNSYLEELIQYENMQNYVEKEKVLNKLYNKAIRKLNVIVKKNISSLDKVNLLMLLKESTNKKVNDIINDDQYNYEHNFKEFFEQIDYEIKKNQHIDTIDEKEEEIETIVIAKEDLDLVEDFYSTYHLYFKKKQIVSEIKDSPFILDFYRRFNLALQTNETETKINLLEELISDISESDVKKEESVRRILTVTRKIIDHILLEEKDNENKTDEVLDDTDESEVLNDQEDQTNSSIIQVGKFMLLKDSEEANPLSIHKLINLLSFDSQDKGDLLENMVFRIGYDKVQGYLFKHPKINIYDLESVIQTDRKLRFEYQKVLEEIEMYFRSSLTYFITNKYDKKFKKANMSGYFYHRGYLNKSIFADRDEHYVLISQLNERIDTEIKNNNQQIEAEYKKYRYSLNFSTAAGIMTFGWVLNIFQILNYYDKSEYLMRYFKGITPQTFYAWMMSLNNLRNKCAHYQSLYRLSSLKELRPIMTKDIDANEYDDKIKRSSLFYYTLVMARLCPDVTSIEDFIDTLSILFRKAGRENYTFNLELDYSFPSNWQIILEREKNSKIGITL